MPAAEFVLRERELVELGHGDPEGLVDPLQAPAAGFFRGVGDPEQEVGAVRILCAVSRSFRIPNQVRDEVQVPDRAQVLDDRAELAVGV